MKKFTKFLMGFLISLAVLIFSYGLLFGPDFILKRQKLKIEKIETAKKAGADERIISIWIKKTNKAIPRELCDLIAVEVCKKTAENNLPLTLIVAIMQRESHFNPLAVSNKKALGLMQILNGGKGISIDLDKAFDVSYNIAKGIEIFNEHLKLQKGDLDKALCGYVGGDKTYANDIYKIIGELDMFIIANRNKEGENK